MTVINEASTRNGVSLQPDDAITGKAADVGLVTDDGADTESLEGDEAAEKSHLDGVALPGMVITILVFRCDYASL